MKVSPPIIMRCKCLHDQVLLGQSPVTGVAFYDQKEQRRSRYHDAEMKTSHIKLSKCHYTLRFALYLGKMG